MVLEMSPGILAPEAKKEAVPSVAPAKIFNKGER